MADLKQLIADRTAAGSQAQVWTPLDFLDLGSRDAVDKALQRLVSGASFGASTAACTTLHASID